MLPMQRGFPKEKSRMIQRSTLVELVCDNGRGEGKMTQRIPLVPKAQMVTQPNKTWNELFHLDDPPSFLYEMRCCQKRMIAWRCVQWLLRTHASLNTNHRNTTTQSRTSVRNASQSVSIISLIKKTFRHDLTLGNEDSVLRSSSSGPSRKDQQRFSSQPVNEGKPQCVFGTNA